MLVGRPRRRCDTEGRRRAVGFLAAYLFAAGFYLVTAVNALNLATYSGSDAGVFNAVFYQLSQGRRLYRDVFDHKDPLFYYLYTAARIVFGASGPMLWEMLISLSTIGVLFLILRRIGYGPLLSLGCVLTYLAFYFSPRIYAPLHTYHQALLFLFLALYLALTGRIALAGGAYAAAVLSKLTVLAFAPSVIVGVAFPLVRYGLRPLRQRFARWSLGAVTVGLGVAIWMLARGELAGYLDAVQVNLRYADIFASAVAPNRPFPQMRVTLGQPLLWFLLLSAVVLGARLAFIALQARRLATVEEAERNEILSSVGLVGAAVGSVLAWMVILLQGAWFGHYFMSVAPSIFLCAASLPTTVRAALPRQLLARPIASLGASAIGIVMITGGFAPLGSFSARAMKCPEWNRRENDPTFAACARQFVPNGGRFAVVGSNAGYTAAGATPEDFVLVCRLFYQFPWLGEQLISEFVDCLANRPDVVFVRPLLYFDAATTERIRKVISQRYQPIGQCGDTAVWRRSAPAQSELHRSA